MQTSHAGRGVKEPTRKTAYKREIEKYIVSLMIVCVSVSECEHSLCKAHCRALFTTHAFRIKPVLSMRVYVTNGNILVYACVCTCVHVYGYVQHVLNSTEITTII